MIRQAILNDTNRIAEIIVSSWKTAYRGLINDNFLDNMSIDLMITKWMENISKQNQDDHIYVYEENNKILGVIRFGKPSDINYSNYNAEIHVLYVDPNSKRHGIGSKLFYFATDYFIKNNLTNMIIWCLNNNTPSIKFYESLGGTVSYKKNNTVNKINLEEIGITYNLSQIFIRDYSSKYATDLSKIITKNLLEVNSKDYGMDYVQKFATEFTVPKIQKNFPKRTKVFVALQNNKVVGTASLDKSWYNDDGEYWILTVFVDVAYHNQGVGKMLIKEIEKYALKINTKKLVVPASISGCGFYYKLGYTYKDGKKELNQDQVYIMEKYL